MAITESQLCFLSISDPWTTSSTRGFGCTSEKIDMLPLSPTLPFIDSIQSCFKNGLSNYSHFLWNLLKIYILMICMICHLNGCSDISPVWLEGYPQWYLSPKEVYEHYALSVALQVHHFVSLFPIVSLLESSTHMCNLQLLVFASWHYSRLTVVLVLLLNCLWSIWFHWWLELYCGASST